jgi:hypothetical protein
MIYPVLGIDEQGKLVMLMSPIRLNKMSVMHLRGNPPPASVQAIIKGDEADAINALRDMHKYYQSYFDKKQNKKRK